MLRIRKVNATVWDYSLAGDLSTSMSESLWRDILRAGFLTGDEVVVLSRADFDTAVDAIASLGGHQNQVRRETYSVLIGGEA